MGLRRGAVVVVFLAALVGVLANDLDEGTTSDIVAFLSGILFGFVLIQFARVLRDRKASKSSLRSSPEDLPPPPMPGAVS
jgi:NhaP-type Na+/H+ or K+/H+ antiporter